MADIDAQIAIAEQADVPDDESVDSKESKDTRSDEEKIQDMIEEDLEKAEIDIRKYGSAQIRIGIEDINSYKKAFRKYKCEITNPVHTFNEIYIHDAELGPPQINVKWIPAHTEHKGKFLVNYDEDRIVINATPEKQHDSLDDFARMDEVDLLDLSHSKHRICRYCYSVLFVVYPGD